jgi:hypothetical protein
MLDTNRSISKVFIVCSVILCFCGTSCKTINDSDNDALNEIIGKSISVAGDIADARILNISGKTLYFNHQSSSPMLSKYKIIGDSIKLIDNLISKGNGPYELGSLLVYSASPNGNDFYFNDLNLRKFIHYNGLNDSIAIHKFMRDGEPVSLLRFAVGHPRGALFTCVSRTNRVAPGIVGLVSAKDSTFIALKGVGTEDMNNIPLGHQFHFATNSQVFVQPGGSKCLFVSNTGLYAEVFEITGDQATNKKILVNNVPSYTLDDHGLYVTASDDLKCGFKVSVTSDRIYLAPLRQTYNEWVANKIKNDPKFSGIAQGYNFVDEVWEYDWKGNIITKYRLYPGVSSFQVTNNGVLWGTSEDENYDTTLMRYQLTK